MSLRERIGQHITLITFDLNLGQPVTVMTTKGSHVPGQTSCAQATSKPDE